MKFVAYIDREGTLPPPPTHAPGEPIIIEVRPETLVRDATKEALRAARVRLREPHFSTVFVRDASQPNPELVPFPRVAIAEDGQFIWTEGAMERVRFVDLERARERGFFTGDPYGVFLERPLYGDGVIPGWDEFLTWLLEFAFIAGVQQFMAVMRRRYRQWRDRGARSPYAFLDLVVARDEWNRNDLSTLLGLDEQEAIELLSSLGFEPRDETPDIWVPSPNRDRSELRRKIIEDYLHRHPERDDEEDSSED